MKMKKICFVLMLFVPFLGVKAQETMTPKERITQVMQSEEDFLYADQTCTTMEQALERAQAILMHEVDAYLKQSGEDGEVVKGIVTEQMVTITVQRGDKYRAFVYVNKSSLGAESLTDTVNTSSIEDSAQTETDKSTILGEIANMTSRLQIYDYIQLLKKDGVNITFFERPSTDEQTKMYIILYRRGGNIEAILTPPDENGIRLNLSTGEPDTKNNHPSTSVNGFTYIP